MNSAEIAEFLAAPRHAVVGTVRRDGGPQLSPVWYLYEDDKIYIGITRDTAKYRNLRRDDRICVCVDGGREDVRTVTIYGTARMLDKSDPLQEEIRWRIIQHYIPDPTAAQSYRESSLDWDTILVIVTPEKIISQDFR